MNTIITIGRSFGSGGREVGKRLADVLDFSYFDEEIIKAVAKESGLHPDYLARYSEAKVTRNYPIMIGRTFSYHSQPSPGEEIQILQMKIIKEVAEKGNCIFVGRCADYILREQNPFKIFIYTSDMEARIQRCYDKVPSDKDKSEKEMSKMILSVDNKRRKYYEQLTTQKWGDMQNYNLCIDTSKVGIKNAVEIIAKARELIL